MLHHGFHHRLRHTAGRALGLSVLFLLALGMSPAVLAEERLLFGNPEQFCRNGAFPGGGEYPGDKPTFQLAELTGQSEVPIPFLADDDGSGKANRCPRADNPNCKQNDVVHAGDRVILSKTYRGLACAWHQPRRGRESVGWLPLDRLMILASDPNPPIERWLGTWKGAGEPLTLRQGRMPGAIQVEGMAYWPGPNLPNTHVGSLAGSAIPVHNTLLIEDSSEPEPYRCKARLVLVGDLLVVSDNHRCGGLNVNFDGVYQKMESRQSSTRGWSPASRRIGSSQPALSIWCAVLQMRCESFAGHLARSPR
jgi:hypothetical protein